MAIAVASAGGATAKDLAGAASGGPRGRLSLVEVASESLYALQAELRGLVHLARELLALLNGEQPRAPALVALSDPARRNLLLLGGHLLPVGNAAHASRMRIYAHACGRACAYVFACACVRAHERMCVCTRVRTRAFVGEGGGGCW